jgi:hypothetical protein
MRGGGLIDPELAEAVNNSAVMVSLISRAYLKSKYCINDELFGFYNKAIEEEGVGFSVNNQSRIFPIFIDNLDPEKTEAYLPKGLRGVRRFAFHEQGRAPGLVAKPLAASDPAYEAAMENLCDQLERLLNFFPHDARNEPQQSPPQHIFLAAVDESLKRIRDDFRRELEEGDLVLVHEDVPPPPERHGHDKAARSALKNSRISVHMLSGHPGEAILFNQFSTYPLRQAELALESRKKPIFWVAPDVDIDKLGDSSYAEFLKSLRKKADVIEGKEMRFLSETVRERLRPKPLRMPTKNLTASAREDSPRPSRTRKVVLLEAQQKDAGFANELEAYLQAVDIGVCLCDISSGLEPVRQELKERMLEALAYIVIHGAGNRDWTLGRLREAARLSSLEKLRPKFWVCLTPSMGEALAAETGKSLLNYEVLDTRSGIDGPKMEPLIRSLASAREN